MRSSGHSVREVQVQTILNHAWSEMEHDILYKRPRLDGFGGRLMSDIEERMQSHARLPDPGWVRVSEGRK
ncbi:MAG: hypothetical protein IPL15_09780 [Comamonadaceae bacterium]|nr:hypothetical protein [Comamonadaceae bacterium]